MLCKYSTHNRNISILATILAVLFAAPAFAHEVGLLGLYRAGNATAIAELESGLSQHGCSLRREGAVVDANGPLKLPAAERFVLLECHMSMLGSDTSRSALQPLGADVVWLEGALTGSSGLAAPTEPGRSYVIKLSRYNDNAPADRDRDVAAINLDAATRANGFRNEAVIAVTRTSGVDALDEVTLLYYESAAQGKAFREANSDLMKRIGAFNKAHLVDYVYMNASAER